MRPRLRRCHRGLLALLAAGMFVVAATHGCGTDDVGSDGRMVGGRCVTDGDCVKRCMLGSAFPGGYCTVACATHSDCPGGAACVAGSGGGVCLATCRVPTDCDGFGAAYRCNRHISQSGGAEARACAAN